MIQADQFPIEVYGVNEVNALWQVLPIDDARVALSTVSILQAGSVGLLANRQVAFPPIVWGDFYLRPIRPALNSIQPNSETHQASPQAPGIPRIEISTSLYSIDTDRGLIKFSAPVYYLSTNSDKPNVPASLRLRCAFEAKDVNDRTPVRYTVTRELSQSSPTESKPVLRDDLHLGVPQDGTNNLADLNQAAS
jgi:hypothetical protein